MSYLTLPLVLLLALLSAVAGHPHPIEEPVLVARKSRPITSKA